MRRVLCVWLPTFSTDLVKRRLARNVSPESPDPDVHRRAMLLVRAVASREVVARRCERAAAARIAPGMDLAHARSLLPPGAALHMEPHRPERDAAALRSLAEWALKFSPLVAPDEPDGLMLDITGAEHLHRGEAGTLRAVARAMRRLGFPCCAAIASTFGCAWALSRFGDSTLARVDGGQERAALASLPVAALRVNDQIAAHLREVGITTIGQVLDLPRASLVSRFDGALVHRLMQAIGLAGEQIDPVRPAPPLRRSLMFDGPTDHVDSVEEAARVVLHDLLADLLRRQRGVRQLDVELLRPHVPPTCVTIHLSRPSASGKHLWSLLRSRLERVDMLEGGQGVEGIVQTVRRSAPLRHRQQTSPALGGSDDRGAETQWGELVDTLAARLGPDKVVHLDVRESHLPEQAFLERSAMAPGPRRAHERARVAYGDRPTRLFRRPELADAMAVTPDGPILSLGWRGRRWTVTSCLGPERIGQEWWRWAPPELPEMVVTEDGVVPARRPAQRQRIAPTRPLAPPDRDYFVLHTLEGRCLWVCRHVVTGRWFVHGEWS